MAKRPLRIYHAAPLFSTPELMYNIMNVKKLRAEGFACFNPQDHALVGNSADPAFRQQIHDDDHLALEECDVCVAYLEGVEPDSGTVIEVGIAHQMGKPVYGIRADRRTYCDPVIKVNNMVLGCLVNATTYECVEEIIPMLHEEEKRLEDKPEPKCDMFQTADYHTKELDELVAVKKTGVVESY